MLLRGARLGPYEILAPIGVGGMGEAYRARDARLGRDVALKVVSAAVTGAPQALARFEREARAVAALSHPNILAIHDVGQHGGTAYVVTELLEGETLRARLAGSRVALHKVVDYAVQMARGLTGAHDKGIVHRDLKPGNVMLTGLHRALLDASPPRGAHRRPAERPVAPSGGGPGLQSRPRVYFPGGLRDS